MVRMDVDDYMNQQEALEDKLPVKCVVCGKTLKPEDEYVCEECYDKQCQEDMKYLKEMQDEEMEYYAEDWRFKDIRGRSVFRRE